MEVGQIALVIAGASLLVNVGVLLFGGGRGFSDRIGHVHQSIMAELGDLRAKVSERIERSENNVGDAMSAMRQKVHDIEKAALEQRAVAAETYMRRDSYYKSSDELKRDMKEGFEKIERRLDRMEKNAPHD